MSWIRVRTSEGHEVDRHESDPRIGDTLTKVEGYPTAHRPRPTKYRTDKDGQPPDLLKGAALDDALDVAGLPKTGTADEKRALLIEHEIAADAAPAATDTKESK